MRIQKEILTALEQYQKNIPGEYYIFGSRVDDTKRGGDIDILVINKSDKTDLKLSIEIERDLFTISEEKYDVVVFPEEMNQEQKLFFENISKQQIGQN